MLVSMALLLAGSRASGQEMEREAGKAGERARFELGEVVVTATRIEEPIRNIARNVTVITAEDIEQAPSNNVVDLLAREADVNLQSFFGHDKNAGVDIRGQGITAVSNVLVLVDGFKLNPPDLAGPDFSSIPLDQIERIEIIRGAASVLYGDGAVGGVINIITKKGQGKTAGKVSGSYGSYDTGDAKASVGGQVDRFSYNLNAGYYDTDGYRQNGFYRRADVSAKIGYELLETTDLSLSGTYKEDEQGFTGGVPIQDIGNRDLRRNTRSPNDGGESEDLRLLGQARTDLGQWGEFSLNGGYRQRQNDFILGFTPLKSISEQQSRIEEDTATLDFLYRKDFAVGSLKQTLQGGVNSYYTDYITARPDQLVRKNGLVNDLGLFINGQGAILEKLYYNMGYRYNRYDGEFRNDDLRTFGANRVWVNGAPFERDWKDDAVDFGLVFKATEYTSAFASYATSFRIPNVDELALAVEDLKPQQGEHIDLGVRQRLGNLGEGSVTLFQITTENEIFFDNLNQVNRNFEDETRRRGVELDVKLYPTSSLYIWGNYTYLQAKFLGTGTIVPLVPEHTFSLGFEWRLWESLLVSATGSYVSSKFDGNDFTNNRFAKIDPYTVVDCKITYMWKSLKVFFGINNLFDEYYSTLAFSETYYTMPTRNFFGGVEWRF